MSFRAGSGSDLITPTRTGTGLALPWLGEAPRAGPSVLGFGFAPLTALSDAGGLILPNKDVAGDGRHLLPRPARPPQKQPALLGRSVSPTSGPRDGAVQGKQLSSLQVQRLP